MKRPAKPEQKQTPSKEQKPARPEFEIAAPEERVAHGRRADFPIVGIDASAGGLAAFEEFFSDMPADNDPGMAFVLVQHLASDHESTRDMLVVSEQNVIRDPPFSKLDLISCRNLLIDMGGDLQKKLIPETDYDRT